MESFPGFCSKIDSFMQSGLDMDSHEFKLLLCADCEFFTPGEDEDLECGCYHILRRLLVRGCITLEQLRVALGE